MDSKLISDILTQDGDQCFRLPEGEKPPIEEDEVDGGDGGGEEVVNGGGDGGMVVTVVVMVVVAEVEIKAKAKKNKA